MRILVLSPYQAYSHKIWLDQLVEGFPDIEWRVLALPARHFNWRIRSNPLHWYLCEEALGEAGPDLILATSMTDLATFRGLFQRELGDVPAVVYFHENQFAYPVTPGATESVEPLMVNLYSALCADRVVFNSRFNRRTFLSGAERFLERMPDRLPRERLGEIEDKSEVIPVPVRDRFFDAGASGGSRRPMRVLWNHRWEHDKGPDRLLAAVDRLVERGAELELVLAGQRFRDTPPALAELERRHARRIRDHGFLAEPEYAELLAGCSLVVSTALHDFQGLAILEAVAAGCVPVVPDRLVYPEWFDARYRYEPDPDPERDGRALAEHILALGAAHEPPAAPPVDGFRFDALADRYRAMFNAVAGKPAPGSALDRPA